MYFNWFVCMKQMSLAYFSDSKNKINSKYLQGLTFLGYSGTFQQHQMQDLGYE